MRPTKLVDFEGIARYHNVNIMLYVPKKDGGKDAVSLWQDSAQKQLVHKKHGIIGRPCLYVTKWMCFVSDGNVRGVSRHLRETRT